MSEDDFSHEINISHRQGKMLMADWDFILDAPDNSTLYCLTDQQVRVILAFVDYIGWTTRYYSTIGTPINQDDVDALRAGIVNALMTDKCQELLDKIAEIKEKVDTIDSEIDDLQIDLDLFSAATEASFVGLLAEMTGIIEPSIAGVAAAVAGVSLQVTGVNNTVNEMEEDVDNIETIISDPADGLAEVSADVDNIELVVSKMKNQVTNITNNTIISINFGVPDQTFTSDSSDRTLTATYARYNALCEAIVDWILIEGYAVMDLLGATPTDLNTLAASIHAYALSLAYVMTPGVPAYSISTILGAFTDSAAVNDVACAMITYLADLAPTSLNFSAALSAYTPPALPDNRHVIYDTLLIALFDLQAFQGFSSILGPAYDAQIALNPTGYNCPPCGTFPGFCGIPQTWDFTLGQKAPWLINRGELVLGQGIVGTQIPGDSNFAVEVNIYFNPVCTAILTHKIEVTHAKIANVGNSFVLQHYYLLAGVETLYNSGSRAQVTAWPGFDVDQIAIISPPGGVGISRLRFATLTPYAPVPTLASSVSSAAVISKIRFIT